MISWEKKILLSDLWFLHWSWWNFVPTVFTADVVSGYKASKEFVHSGCCFIYLHKNKLIWSWKKSTLNFDWSLVMFQLFMNRSLLTDAIWLIIADGDDNGDSDTMYTLWSFGCGVLAGRITSASGTIKSLSNSIQVVLRFFPSWNGWILCVNLL